MSLVDNKHYTLKSFEKEQKIRSLNSTFSLVHIADTLYKQLISRGVACDKLKLSGFINNVSSLDYQRPGLKAEEYLSHPFRVAKIIASYSENLNYEEIKLALSHNVIEVVTNSSGEIKKAVSSRLYEKIKLLTVDRKYQWDWSYKKNYYNKIEESNLASKIKVADKLDNIFLLNKNPDKKVKRNYIYEIESFVIPITSSVLPALEEYFKSCLAVVKHDLNRQTMKG